MGYRAKKVLRNVITKALSKILTRVDNAVRRRNIHVLEQILEEIAIELTVPATGDMFARTDTLRVGDHLLSAMQHVLRAWITKLKEENQ